MKMGVHPTGLRELKNATVSVRGIFRLGALSAGIQLPWHHFIGYETPDRGFLGAAGNTVGPRPHLPRSHIKCRHWTHGMSAAGPGHSGNQA